MVHVCHVDMLSIYCQCTILFTQKIVLLLFSPSPAAVGSTSPILPEDQAANEQQARRELNVDSSQPVTMIQIRLADGTNVRSQFNLTHTVADIRQFIIKYPLKETYF